MYFLIIYIPFLNFIILSFLGRYLNKKNSMIISLINLILTFIIALFIFYEIVLLDTICFINAFNWIIVNEFIVNWTFLFDNLTSSMLIIIVFISALVHLYSYEYMSLDPHLNRFVAYLSLFTTFMVFLVTSANFLQLFIGWEGVGLASYLLINFWYTRINANKSALKAVILNRVGDLSLFLAFSIVISIYKTLDYNILYIIYNKYNNNNFFLNINEADLISFFFLIGAVGKSAQIGLHVWLPDAMEGPTPVSALIHAATMVTAGIFLLIRSSFIIEHSIYIYNIIAIIGGLTALFASTIGISQNDIKRIIAYSTCSQLGYMTFACGLHHYDIGFFHLFNHAFFKALLFLSAGAVIHSLNNEQDIRRLGGLLKLLPLNYISFLIGSLTLAGFPFLTGYFSKDFILEIALTSYNIFNIFIYWLGCLGAFCTAFYSSRLLIFVFFFKTQTYKKNLENIHENNYNINITLIILSICSIFIGFLFKDLMIGLGSKFWNNILILNPNINNIFNSEFLDLKFKLFPTILSIFGIFLAFIVYHFNNNYFFFKLLINSKTIKYLYFFLNKRWYFDIIYNYFIVKNFLEKGFSLFFKIIDKGFLENFGPIGIIKISYKFNKNLKNIGFLYIYFYYYIIFIFSMLIILLIYNNFKYTYTFYLFFEVFFYLFFIRNILKIKSKKNDIII